MNIDSPYRICHSCLVPHYENCPACFGYGCYPGNVPISAAEAALLREGATITGDALARKATLCIVCLSTVFGIPTFEAV